MQKANQFTQILFIEFIEFLVFLIRNSQVWAHVEL